MAISRITFSSNIILIRDNLLRVQNQYQDAAVPSVTGQKINTLSDDATVTSRLFSLRSLVKDNEQYQRNNGSARVLLNFTESRLAQSIDTLQRTREIVVRANDPTVNTAALAQMGTQISEMKTEFLSYANAKFQDKYVFSGTAVSTQPFTGTPTAFQGNTNNIQFQASDTLKVTVNLNGNKTYTGSIATATTSSLATSLKNSNSVPLEVESGDTITITGANTAVGGDLATTLTNSTGTTLNVASGDTITIAGTAGAAISATINVGAATSLTNIATSLQAAIRAASGNNDTVAVQADGSLRVTADGTDITNLTMSISGKSDFNTAFTFPTTIAGAGTGDSATLNSAYSSTLAVTSTTAYSDIATAVQTLLRAQGNGTETAAVQADGSLRVTSGATVPIVGLNLAITDKTDFNTAFTYSTTIAAGSNTADSNALKTGDGEDIMDVFDDLQTAVTAGNSTDIATHLKRLDYSLDQLLNARTDVGTRLQQIESLDNTLAEDNVRVVEDLSDIQDASMDVVLSDLVTRETALRLVFASSSRILGATTNLQLGS